MSEDEKKDPTDDTGENYIIPGPQLPNGRYAAIHHHPDHTLEPIEIKPIESGAAMPDDAIMLEKRSDEAYNVVGTVGDLKKGPAKVNSIKYKENYDKIFPSKSNKSLN